MLDFGYAAADNLQLGLSDGSAPFGHVLQDRSCLSRGIPETRLGYAVHDSQLFQIVRLLFVIALTTSS